MGSRAWGSLSLKRFRAVSGFLGLFWGLFGAYAAMLLTLFFGLKGTEWNHAHPKPLHWRAIASASRKTPNLSCPAPWGN